MALSIYNLDLETLRQNRYKSLNTAFRCSRVAFLDSVIRTRDLLAFLRKGKTRSRLAELAIKNTQPELYSILRSMEPRNVKVTELSGRFIAANSAKNNNIIRQLIAEFQEQMAAVMDRLATFRQAETVVRVVQCTQNREFKISLIRVAMDHTTDQTLLQHLQELQR